MFSIAFEGLDGAGKTTQAQRILRRLLKVGCRTRFLPLYKNDSSEEMLARIDARGHVTPECSRYTVAAKLQLRQEWLLPKLQGKFDALLFDKFLLTFFATEKARGAPIDEISMLLAGLKPPDLVFCFLVPVEVALERTLRRGGIGYREAGLDVADNGRMIMTVTEFKRSPPSQSTMEELFIRFQSSVLGTFEAVRAEMSDWAEATSNTLAQPSLVRFVDGQRHMDDIESEIFTAIVEHSRMLIESGAPLCATPFKTFPSFP